MWIEAGVGVTLMLAGGTLVRSFGYDARRLEDMETQNAKNAKELSEHVVECNKRREENANLSKQVEQVSSGLRDSASTQRWMGDGIVKIAAKMNIDLPERP